MKQLTISQETFEKLLDVLEWQIAITERQLRWANRGQQASAEDIEALEEELVTYEALYQRARDEAGHVWETV